MKSIKKYIPIEKKLYLTYLFSKNNHYYKEYKDKKKIIVCLGADYGNLGDVAITLSQIEYLKKLFPEYIVMEYPISKTFCNFKSLREIINQDDIITIVGGGNTTYKYRDIEYCRQFIIKKFKKNIIFSFPQSVDFTDATPKFINKMKKVYMSHHNFYYFVREKYSFNTIKNQMPNLKCFLYPDIVFSYDINYLKLNRSIITLTIRNDKERYLNDLQRQKIVTTLEKYGKINFRDTQCIDEVDFSMENRKRMLEDLLKVFYSSKLVVTDRLHGMILSYITNTPCIVLPCNNKKIKGCYEWIKNSDNVFYIEEFNEDAFNKIVEKFINIDNPLNNKINFDKMNEIIKKAMENNNIKLERKINNELSK